LFENPLHQICPEISSFNSVMEEDEKSIFGGACFPETVHTYEGNSISSGRMEITSGIPPVLHAHSGISPKRELAIQEAYPIIK
jgi:hypothetical protein